MAKIILGVKLYTLTEVSTLLGVTRQSVSLYMKEGRLKAQTISGRKYISENSLKDFLMN